MKRKALLATSALVPVAMANLLFTPEAEAVTLDRDNFRELPEFGRVLYHAVNAVEWEIDEETGALKVLFDDGWRGVFDLGEYIVEGDALFLWPENIFVQAYPVHAVWNILWGHPAGAMAGGGIWWLMGRNDAPVAVDDVLAFTEGDNQGDNAETLSFNVLGDDYDENNDTISLLPFADVTGTFGRFTMNAAGTDIEYHFLDDINATNLAEGETGTDTARYQIQDEHGLTDTATLTVTVTGINKQVVDGNEPSAKPKDGDVSEDATSAVTLTNLLVNASDADGGVPFISAVAGGTLGEAVAANGGGSFTITANGVASFDPDGDFDYLDAGDTTTVSIDYTVSDGRGSTTSSTVTVTIIGENDGFTDPDESATVNEDTVAPLSNILSVNDDPDLDDTHTITAVGGSNGLVFSPSDGGKLTVTANGAASFDPEDDFQDLAAGETKEVKISYTVSDSAANGNDRETDSSTLTLTVQGRNDTFTDGNETLTVSEDATAAGEINILGNNGSISDDPDTNDEHTIKTFNGQTVPAAGLTLNPSEGGTLTVAQNGAVTFDPGDDFDKLLLQDEKLTFTYKVTDNASASAHTDTSTLTIEISAKNDPISDGNESYTDSSVLAVTENKGISTGLINVLDNVTDKDAGDTKHVSENGTKISGTETYSGSEGGTFTLTADGAMTFDPGSDFDKLGKGDTTTTVFTYEVTDGDTSDTSTVTVKVTGVNDAPEAEDIDLSFTEDKEKTTSFSVPSNVSDADNDTLTVSFTNKTGTYGTFSQTANGDIQYAFANNAEAQSLKADETKTETATYTVSDGNGGTDTATLKVTITGVNDAPVAKADFTGSATEDAGAQTITFNAVTSATDVDAGTSLTLSSTLKNETSDYGDFVVSTDGKKVEYKFDDDGEADKLEAGETAEETVTYTINDGNGGSDSETITVTITGVNDAPTVETKANDIALQDTETGNDAVFLVPADGGGYKATAGNSIGLTFDDVDDSSLTLTVSGLPDGLTYKNDGSITGTAKLSDPLKPEKHTVTVKATDDGDANGSNLRSASDTLDIYIGLNISENDGNIEPGQSYTIEGSDVADDSIDPNKKRIGAGAGNKVTIDLGDGINYFKTSFNAASDYGKISYTGGDGSDEVRFLQFAARNRGEVTVDAGDGDNTLYLGNYAASNTGSITYTGGTGEDGIEVNFFLAKDNGTVTFDLGDDTASDQITFKGSVADKSAASNYHGTVTIQNFDPNGEDSLLFTYEQQDGISPATLDFLLVEQSGQDVIIRSPESVVISNETIDIEFNSPLYVYLTVENANAADFALSIDNGDLLIN